MNNIPTIPAKSIVYRAKSPFSWFGIDYTMNIYRGCSHGCIYCDSRSDCYQIKDFDTVKAKEDALRIIRDDLRRKAKTGVVATGAMSDPYNPLERNLSLTRNALELINAFGFGAFLCTKSALVARDIDVLQDISSHSPVIVTVSITAADDKLCKKIEPHVSLSSERFEALRSLAAGGIFCGVMMTPILPFINDSEENIISILRMAKEAGAEFVNTYMSMTLRNGNREHYYDRLDKHFPGIKEEYIKRYGYRYSLPPPGSKKLWGVFTAECERLGLLYDMKAITRRYKAGYGDGQLRLY